MLHVLAFFIINHGGQVLENLMGARWAAAVSTLLNKLSHTSQKLIAGIVGVLLIAALVPSIARAWNEDEFEHRPLFAYPLPHGRDNIIGNLITYEIQKGDTLLDVGRWFGCSAKEISDANNHIDWWTPKAGTKVILTDEHILPDTPRVGIVLNIPEMRLYYYYPSPTGPLHPGKKKKPAGGITPAAFVTGPDGDHKSAEHKKGKHKRGAGNVAADVVYTFPVGLGRFDWKTPIGEFAVTAKVKDPTWVVPDDIYKEHMERDGEAEHVVHGGDPDNPLGRYKLDLSLPEYGIHGTNVPWGVGMEVSHGCIRLYPEDIERLFHKVKVGTPGRIVYQPIKFGWRGDSLYVEVHDDLYGKYPGLWSYAQQLVKSKGLDDQVDAKKLEAAVVAKSGIPTYVMPGPPPDSTATTASSAAP